MKSKEQKQKDSLAKLKAKMKKKHANYYKIMEDKKIGDLR